MLDAFLDWAVVLLPTVLSVVGVLVSLKAPQSKHHTALRIGLITFGVLVSGITFWQQARSRSAHASEVTALNGKLNSVQGDLNGLQTETNGLKAETVKLRGEQEAEAGRRQQAEKDLLIVVQSSGKATREGIAQDIRKTPLKVEVNGQPIQDLEEKKRIRESLGNFMQRGMSLRDRCATDVPEKDLEAEAQAWFVEVQQFLKNNLDSSYISQFVLTHPDPLTPGVVRAEMLPLWHGFNQRTQTLSRFIDQLK